MALRDIPAGEELTYDYRFDLTEWRDHPCRCGAPGCVGFIVNRRLHWRVRRILASKGIEKPQMNTNKHRFSGVGGH